MALPAWLPQVARGIQEGDFVFRIDGDKAVITAYAGSGGAIEIPNLLGGKPVATIGEGAFSDCDGLTSVSIPGSVASIGASAFGRCQSLTNVTIGSGVTEILGGAFYGCSGLSSIAIPNTVSSIGSAAFSHCHGLTSVTIPSSAIFIGPNPFLFCSGLTNIDVDPLNPQYVSVSGVLFTGARTGLVSYPAGRPGAYTVPTSVRTVLKSAFGGCIELSSMTIPSSLTAIGDYAFVGCNRLAGAYFEGNAPSTGFLALVTCRFLTVFYRAGTVGWGTLCDDRPTSIWVSRPNYAEWIVSTGLVAQFPTASGEADDPDRDGVSNRDEWISGTDPTQRVSRLELELNARLADLASSDKASISVGQSPVYFRSVPGRYYGVESASTLGSQWELEAVRIATPDTTQTRILLPASDPQAFHRVRLLQ